MARIDDTLLDCQSREALPSMEELTLELQELAEWTLALRDAPIEDNYLGPIILET